MAKPIEELYASEEIQEAFERGRRWEQSHHKCPRKKELIKTKVVYDVRPRRGYGVVSNGRLLNPTFKSMKLATDFILGLVPADPNKRLTKKIDAQAIRL